MKATAVAHPIQGLVKYHGMRDHELRLPYHDSISVCTAPSRTVTTVAFDDDLDGDRLIIEGEELEGSNARRLQRVIDAVRNQTELEETPVRFESESNFPTNVGLGSSSSGMAAAAVATAGAAELDLSRGELSAIARLGSASAARSVTGGFSLLPGGGDDETCQSVRLESPLEDELRIVVATIEAYKETGDAHREAPQSHMFDARLAHVHDQLATARRGLRAGEFDTVFECAEADSLSLAATTMTGPAGWIYWRPTTLEVFDRVRSLRSDGVPAYFSTDTGASVYINTTAEAADQVESTVAELDVDGTEIWRVGGPAHLDDDQALF